MKAKRTWITIVCLGMFSLHAVASEHNSIDSSNDAVRYAATPAEGIVFATPPLPFLLNVSTASHAVVPLIRSYIAAHMATRFAPPARSFTINKTIPALSGGVSDTLNSLPMIGSMYRRAGPPLQYRRQQQRGKPCFVLSNELPRRLPNDSGRPGTRQTRYQQLVRQYGRNARPHAQAFTSPIRVPSPKCDRAPVMNAFRARSTFHVSIETGRGWCSSHLLHACVR